MSDDTEELYEASAIVTGEQSGSFNFVSNRSSTAEGAKSGLRSNARVRFVDDYRPNEELVLDELEVYRLNPETGEPIKRVT